MNPIFDKIKIPRFFKTKKFFLLLSIFILFFLFAPISLHQISKRLEDFINDQAKEGVQTFEKQTGLKIKWKALNFNIFMMTVELENVQVIPLNTANFQKIQALHFLDGLQKIKKISARPSLYSFLFERQIVLSKLKIQNGDIYLKTLKSFLKKKKQPQDIALPIKKIFIENTNLNLTHRDYDLRFSKLRSKVFQKKDEAFHFDLFVEALYINKNSGFKKFQGLRSHWTGKNALDRENRNEVYQLAFKGLANKGQISFEDIHLKNKNFQSVTEWLNVYFDSKGLKKLNVKSSGTLPLSLIQTGMDLVGKNFPFFDSLLSYKFNVQYRKNKGYHGFFEIQGKDALFKSHQLKSFSFKGRLINYLLAVDQSLIETKNQGSINIKKGEWVFKNKPFPFNFSIETDKIDSDFMAQTILNVSESPVKGDFTGLIHCRGIDRGFYFKCSAQGQSENVSIQPKNQNEIVSVHGMNLNWNVEWSNQILNFTVHGKKTDSAEIHFNGQYSQRLNRWEASYSFFGNLYKDLKFNTPFPIEGKMEIQKGQLIVEKNTLQLEGSLRSSLLKIQSYRLKNISSRYKLENKQLRFFGIKGTPDRTNYIAECNIDFGKKTLVFNLESPFFDMEDFLEAVKDNISLPVLFKGTGTISFFMNLPWSFPEKTAFQLKGDLFNVSINKDTFQQVTFDLGIQNEQGVLRSLFFRKGQGSIKGTGVFDNNYALNLDMAGQNLALEGLEWLNEILPFNQSGDVNFSMKITGTPNSPQISSDIVISNMFLYSYPVDDTRIQLKINKKALSFSGRIMNTVHIDQFVYPFFKKSKAEINGQFTDLDFVKILFSKNRIEKTQDYFSQMTGSFSFSQMGKTQKIWTGWTKINKLFIFKSNKQIKSESPFSIFFNEKKWSLTPIKLSLHNNKQLIIETRENNKLSLSGESSLGFFSIFFPFLKEFDGDIKGQILMDNNLKRLNPRGSLQIERGLFSIGILPDFTNVKTSLILSKNNVFINDFTSNAGGGEVEGEGSVFYDFTGWPGVNLNLRFSNVHLNIPKNFNTKGSGRIQVKGERAPYLISGQYFMDSGMITKDFSSGTKRTKYDFSFLNEEVKKQTSIFELKLNIKTKQPVELNSSLIRSSVEGQADIYGPLESLLVDGQFTLPQKSEENLIFFRGQEFEINSGSIIFKNSDPTNPLLNIKAHTLFKEQIIDPLESRQEIERKYKILLSVKGPSQNPRFSLKSVPSLKEKEIISLLTLGVGSRRFDANVKQNVADYSYQILASLLLEKPLNKEIKDTLGVDFRLTPYINTLNEPVTKITLSKNWLEKWKTSFSRTIEDAQSDIRLKYNLNQKISLTAFWENAGEIKLEDNQEDRFGLDFEFAFDF